jgi:beta-lactamase regulating signal transducer with metallopeptidase domain
MPGIFETVLSNTLAACVLAGAAWLASRRGRPALAHGLWILVLLKLCTPPLFRVPLGWLLPAPVAAPDAGEAGEKVPEFPFPMAASAAPSAPATSAEPIVPTTPAPEPIDLGSVLLLVWAGGSVMVLGLIATRTRRLSSLLRHAEPAPAELDGEVRILCRRLGIARAPKLALVAGCVTPMLHASPWRARILLPRDLCERMSRGGVRALLAHELAHFARRDHQVRWLEVGCAALLWWHPLVWCARRALRNAEEDCCDAWVVWALPGSSRTYAEALVQTVQFLSAGAGPLPVAATGMGPVQDLNRRLTMIMNPTTPRSLSRLGRLLVLATAAAILPTLPAFAQVENERRSEEIQQMLRQERDQQEKVKDVLEKLARKHDELAQLGRIEEAQAVEKEMNRFGRWQQEWQRTNEELQSQQGGNQDELLEALKKAVRALREKNDERAAATLARHAEELAAQRRQREAPAKNQWLSGRDARRKQFVEQEDQEERAEAAKQEARDREHATGSNGKPDNQWKETKNFDGRWEKNFDGRWETKPDPQKRVWAGKPGQVGGADNFDYWQQAKRDPARQEAPDRQDHRIDELADQVARLSKIVEQLAGKLEDTDKKKRESR